MISFQLEQRVVPGLKQVPLKLVHHHALSLVDSLVSRRKTSLRPTSHTSPSEVDNLLIQLIIPYSRLQGQGRGRRRAVVQIAL